MNARIFARAEYIVSVLAGLVAIGTMLYPDWLERLGGADPDHGDGSVEAILAIGLLALAVLLAVDGIRRVSRASRAPRP